MKKRHLIYAFLAIFIVSCSKGNADDSEVKNDTGSTSGTTTSTEVNPLDINSNTLGFKLLENMQGQWVGINRVIASDYSWFAFDYRANSPSQIHGIFEGGSQGNLLTSFFVTDFKGKRTIKARNGGVLNGIYRSSYFVLDDVKSDANGEYYKLVDAVGGSNTMYMELRFKNDSLYWNAYTSRLGLNNLPTRHMTFKGKKQHLDLAEAAAEAVGFPKNEVAWDFSKGFPEEFLYKNEGDIKAKSASFLAIADSNADVVNLAESSGDLWRIDQTPYLSYLTVNIDRPITVKDKTLMLFLSKEPITDANGYFVTDEAAYDSILLFPELSANETSFRFTYLHPGTYYVNVTADMNADGYPSEGDITHPQQKVIVLPNQTDAQITITNLTIQN